MTLREITVGNVPVRALRVTYVGELGWSCTAQPSMGSCCSARCGRPAEGMASSRGYRAIDSLRLEKGYRVWGADITPDETPYEGGVGFCVKLDKEGGFIGRDALVEAKERGPRTRLCCCSRIHALSRSAASRCGSTARSAGGSRRAGTDTRSSARSRTRTCRPSASSRAPRSRWRSSAAGSGRGCKGAAVRSQGRADPGLIGLPLDEPNTGTTG